MKQQVRDKYIGKIKEIIYKCPNCEGNISYDYTYNTDWYGKLEYFNCKDCKEHLVIQAGSSISISA